MSTRGGAVLYTPEVLALAVELAEHPLVEGLAQRGEAVSRVCGSKVTIVLSTDAGGAVKAIGARVSACAIGQAAAALFVREARGRDAGAIAAALEAIEAWLGGAEELPAWPGITRLEAARAYPARHAAILLPWRAGLAALSNPAPAG